MSFESLYLHCVSSFSKLSSIRRTYFRITIYIQYLLVVLTWEEGVRTVFELGYITVMTASDDVPWKYVDFTVSERMPSVVANECLWLIITFCCFVHAYTRKSPESRMIHYVLFFASILGGIANDIIFMYLPLVDNFWQ